ncbi:DUF2254 domain-containing protein [Neptunicella sp. SCSIO 80796]|uniref:DUF2254 domain-containing protein n=1 Tax=Neptunicella plasticusilytica TaxID=3117012 RepID=UPI003A4E4A06
MNLLDNKRTQLLAALDKIKTSFWFIPSLLVVSALVAAVLFICIDRFSGLNQLDALHQVYQIKPDAARELLTTIAASMMTVVSIAFSITIVALTLASSQFGPRLIRNFMNDSGTQIVLGLFIANFVYCLSIVRAIDAFADADYVPGLSIVWCLFITLVSVFFLIFFIHHVAHSIQADNVIDDVYQELEQSVESLFPSSHSSSELHNTAIDDDYGTQHFSHHSEIISETSGYLQAIDFKALIKLMCEHDAVAQIKIKAGDFVVKDMPMITLHHHEPVDNALTAQLRNCLTLGSKRSPIQDPEFAVHQLVEIALRALSPGINDPYSALTCVDKLTATLCLLTSKTFPQGGYLDQQGTLRLQYKSVTFSGIGNAAFDQIRQYSQTCLAISIRQLESLDKIVRQAKHAEHLDFVKRQATMIKQGLEQQQITDTDCQDYRQRLDHIYQQLPN